MGWILEENVKLNKENKRLIEQNKELQAKLIERNEDSIILDILNAYMVQNKLVEDFDKWIHEHSMEEVYRVKDQVREVWKNL